MSIEIYGMKRFQTGRYKTHDNNSVTSPLHYLGVKRKGSGFFVHRGPLAGFAIPGRDSEEEKEGTRKPLISEAQLMQGVSRGPRCWLQCCLGRLGSYLRSRPREAKPNRKVWNTHRKRVAALSMPLSLQGSGEQRVKSLD